MVREDLQGGTRRGLLSVFLHKKYIHSRNFYLLGSVNQFLNFCVTYFPCCFLKMAIKFSHSHFVHVAFVSILVFQTFCRMIFGSLTFPRTRWYMMTVWDTQMVRNQKKFENHCLVETNLLQLFTHPQHSEWCSIFCYYFWGQHFCLTETNILVKNFVFFVNLDFLNTFFDQCPSAASAATCVLCNFTYKLSLSIDMISKFRS